MNYKAVCLTVVFIGLSLSSNVYPADLNGYTAQYECRAGNANCNVDVVTYTTAACAQTITTADSEETIESKLNTGSSPICVTNGDYTGKGIINITASGTSGAYRAMRYTRASDNDDEPWNQSGANQATFRKIQIAGNFWIVHRLRVDANGGEGFIVNGNDNILSRVEAFDGGDNILVESTGTNTLQNFYSHNATLAPGNDSNGVALGGGGSPRLVNCEVKDIPSHGIYTWGGTSVENAVIENCDVYTSTAMYTDCNGNLTPGNPESPCAASEAALSLKSATLSTNPTKVIHNRWWGTRSTDTDICCIDGSGGQIISLSDEGVRESTYVLFQNNIVMDGPVGIQHPHSTGQGADNHHNSIIGNIVYKIKNYQTPGNGQTMEFIQGRLEEAYLNTFIAAEKWGGFGTKDSDWRCNVFIDTGTRADTAGSNTQVDFNVFYGVTAYTTGSTNVSKTLNTRANSTAYSLDDVIRTTGTPPADGTAGDFLYKVVSAGTSASSPPTYCVKLNCVVTDGTVKLKAIRGPYKFFRKLRTVAAGEATYIPYARAVNLSVLPEFGLCLDTFASRAGVGINNVDNIGSDDRL